MSNITGRAFLGFDGPAGRAGVFISTYTVVRAVHIHVEPKAKEVLMMYCNKVFCR